MNARMAARPRQTTVWYRGIPYTIDLARCRRGPAPAASPPGHAPVRRYPVDADRARVALRLRGRVTGWPRAGPVRGSGADRAGVAQPGRAAAF